jgi:spore coat polysaccharide biosynthesis protein SpsF
VIIDQARMTSTRLPGKVLKEVLGKPLLVWQIERLQSVAAADAIVIATTDNAEDQAIVDLARDMGVNVFRGAEHDVLSRYFGAAKEFSADTVVRVTSDCPLIDPAVVDRLIAAFLDGCGSFDYVSNTRERTFPRGLDAEVFSFAALAEAHAEATKPYEREHVTPFIYLHPQRYRLSQVVSGRDIGWHRWTVDTPEDFELIRRILVALGQTRPDFALDDVLALLDAHPDWIAINAAIRQKELGQ